MADWTLSSGSIVRPVRSNFGAPIIRTYQASTAVSTARITRGDVVVFDPLVATGSFRIRRDLIASTVPSTAILGIALQSDTFSDAAGTGLTTNGQQSFVNATAPNMLSVALANHTEFQANCTGAANSTLLGQYKVLSRDSTLNIWAIRNAGEVGVSTEADKRIQITEVPYPGDTNAPLYFKFMASAQSGSSGSTEFGGYLAFQQ